MALAAVQAITAPGIAQSYAAPAATEQIVPAPNQFLHVKNGNGSTLTVTITDAGVTPAGTSAAAITTTVAATTGDKMIPLNPVLASPTTGTIQVAFSVQTSVLAALLRV